MYRIRMTLVALAALAWALAGIAYLAAHVSVH